MKLEDLIPSLIKGALKALGGGAIAAIAVLFASWTYLLLPPTSLGFLALTKIDGLLRPIAGLSMLASSAWLLALLVAKGVQRIREWGTRRTAHTRARTRLHHLTREEKGLLGDFIREGTRSSALPLVHPTVQELERLEYIVRTAGISVPGAPGLTFPYTMAPWVWIYLHERPDLLGLKPAEVGAGPGLPPGDET